MENTNKEGNVTTTEAIDPVKTGLFIKRLRTEHHLTQEELANRIFITRKAISKWETGKCCPSIDVLKRLTDVLSGVSVEELINGEFKEKTPESEKSFLKRILNSMAFKTSMFIAVLSLFLALITFYYNNKDAVKIYNVYYKDANFSLSDGTLMLSNRESYMFLSKLESNLKDTEEDTKYDFTLYYGSQIRKEAVDSERIILSFSGTLSTFSINASSEELAILKSKTSLNNLYLRIAYEDNDGKDKFYDLKLVVEFDYYGSSKDEYREVTPANIDINTNGDLPEMQFDTADEVAVSSDDIEKIDLSFLYEMEPEVLKETFDEEEIFVDGEKYTVNYENNNELVIESKELAIVLNLKHNIIIIKNYDDMNCIKLKINDNKSIQIDKNENTKHILKKCIRKIHEKV